MDASTDSGRGPGVLHVIEEEEGEEEEAGGEEEEMLVLQQLVVMHVERLELIFDRQLGTESVQLVTTAVLHISSLFDFLSSLLLETTRVSELLDDATVDVVVDDDELLILQAVSLFSFLSLLMRTFFGW